MPAVSALTSKVTKKICYQWTLMAGDFYGFFHFFIVLFFLFPHFCIFELNLYKHNLKRTHICPAQRRNTVHKLHKVACC